jgi:hypothetical protein
MTTDDGKRAAGATWYHGSPLRLEVLRAGSTVTRVRPLAEVFSHKPSIVCIEDDGTVRHDGRRPGWLHRVREEVGGGDVRPHPRSVMAPGKEWLTNRPLELELIGPVPVPPDELLSEEEAAGLRRRAAELRNGGD